jgi:hypothetical protein
MYATALVYDCSFGARISGYQFACVNHISSWSAVFVSARLGTRGGRAPVPRRMADRPQLMVVIVSQEEIRQRGKN